MNSSPEPSLLVQDLAVSFADKGGRLEVLRTSRFFGKERVCLHDQSLWLRKIDAFKNVAGYSIFTGRTNILIFMVPGTPVLFFK